ncbi:MAG: ABC transporter transmembrane domain-containing protein, partial [Streptosporangiaceae bacterium]
MTTLMDSPGLQVASGSGAVTADLVGSGGYVAVVAGELDVFLVPQRAFPERAAAARGRPLLRLAAGHIAPTIAAADLPPGWTVRAAGVAGTVLQHGRLRELTDNAPVAEWVALMSAAARTPGDALAERAGRPVEYPAALRDFHRRALGAAITRVAADDADYAGWRTSREAANQVTLGDACTALAAAAAGRLTDPGQPRTSAERAIAVTGLLGHAGVLSATALAEAEDPMDAALAAAGMRHRPVRLDGPWWRTAAVPLVARYRSGETVALLPSKGRYLLADPGAAERPQVDARLAARFADDAWQVYPPLGAVAAVTELIRHALRGAGRSLGLIAVVGLAAACLGMAVPLLSARLLTSGLAGPDHSARFTWFAVLIGAAVAGSALFTVVRNSLVVRLEGHIQTTLEPAVWARLLSLDVGFFARYSTGDLVQRANSVAAMRRAVGA